MQLVRVIIVFFIVAWFLPTSAQVADNFSDGEFMQNPQWLGDDSLFVVNANQLRSRGTISKDISLSTSASLSPNMEWQCWLRNAFSPSTQNFSRFYLMSDQQDLKGSLNGYYVQLGGITGNADSLMLFKQSGTTRTLLIGGRTATVSKTNNIVRLKITRSANGTFQLFSDTTGSYNFVFEGEATDAQFSNADFIGFFFRFTTTNASNFYADDVYAGPLIVDVTPPLVSNINTISASTLALSFNEAVDVFSATDVLNYSLNNGIGNPINATMLSDTSVLLTLSQNMVSPSQYSLNYSNIEDRNNNTIVSNSISFTYFIPTYGDLVISEFFPDPSPIVGLPEQEFIELYNNSTFSITLSGWTISDLTTSATIPTITIAPDSFVILCLPSNQILFQPFGRVVTVSGLPSLNNSGDEIILRDASGKSIHQLKYDLTWYDDPAKVNGGWTIEMINPLALCSGQSNYRTSIDTKGGTPGSYNSNWSRYRDTIPPVLTTSAVQNENSVLLKFNEKMDSLSLMDASIVTNPSLGISSRLVNSASDELLITFLLAVAPNTVYDLTITDVKDCNQNVLQNAALNFTRFVPDTARQFDILINEFLADPEPIIGMPNAEFIELYNRSNRIISLEGWKIQDNSGMATMPSIIILPDSFVVLSNISSNPLFKQITTHAYGITGFPSLGNDGDQLVLYDQYGKVIHAIAYTNQWYKDNVKSQGGWSLEMVDKNNPCTGFENWQASKNTLGATPGKRNSISTSNPDNKQPDLVTAHLLANNKLRITYSESVDTTVTLNRLNYSINGHSLPDSVVGVSPFYNEVILHYSDTFLENVKYRIVANGVKDCAQNNISPQDYADFAVPFQPNPGDFVINEILFDPVGSGSDFVELYNVSNKAINLQSIYIANADDSNQVSDFYPIALNGYTLMPDDYVVITDNPENIKQQYKVNQPNKFLVSNMPSFSNTEGVCLFINQAGLRFDQLNYTDDMHFKFLDNKDGVSLERIQPSMETNKKENWTSASSSSGYGTPTYKNSQYLKEATGDDALEIFPETFSPDNDGYNDQISFNYKMSATGYVGTMRVYNANGLLQAEVMRNQVLGTEGTVIWDGVNKDGKPSAIGIYTVYFEYYNLQGQINKVKKVFVLAAKL
jgi:hypothetical protein